VGKVDLHIHTSVSDGRFKPSEIVRKAKDAGLVYIAICDHDSLDGIEEARRTAASIKGIEVLEGVEINTDIPAGELHMLGYCCDIENEEIQSVLETLRTSRVERAVKMIKKLRGLGIKIDYERVEELAGGGSVGRPHIAQAMLEKGYINSFKEAFIRFIGHDCPAYVERNKITPAEATHLITRARGIPVLAHPFTFNDPEKMVSELICEGLKGIEVYYGSYTPEQVQTLLGWANKYSLIPTGGSDFHGLDSNVEIPLGTVEVPLESVKRLLAMAGR